MTDDVKIQVNVDTIAAGISIAMGLVKSGYELYEMFANKDALTEQDYLDIIEREDQEYKQAKAKLKALWESREVPKEPEQPVA